MFSRTRCVALLALLCLAPSLFSSRALGQELAAPTKAENETLQTNVDSFFRRLADAAVGPERAIRDLLATSPLAERKEQQTRLVEQAKKLEDLYGRYLGADLIASKSFGADLVILRYLQKCERFPVIWQFYYYHTGPAGAMKREWLLIWVKFDTNLDSLEK